VRGISLADVRLCIQEDQSLPNGVQAGDLASAIGDLVENLRRHRSATGECRGDWAFHNLIFEFSTKRIKNVDLEGLFSYGSERVEASLQYTEATLGSLQEQANLLASPDETSAKILGVLATVWNTTRSGSSHSGPRYAAGYHSLSILGRYFRGQRECSTQLRKVPYDFNGRVVMDLGCNCGGMLHCIADEIRFGIGVDYDRRCTNAANCIADVNQHNNLRFYSFDLERENLARLDHFLCGRKVDILFLLSVCICISNWRDVLRYAARTANALLFESNGTAIQREEQTAQIRDLYEHVELLSECSPDDPWQKSRSLYLCRSPRGK